MKTNTRKAIKGYLTHLVLIVGTAVTAAVNLKHVPLLHPTHAELVFVAQSAWVAVVTNLNKVQEPIINAYLKRKYPALGIVVADLEAAKTAQNNPTAGDNLPSAN
jgi:uncharacterized membrane protein